MSFPIKEEWPEIGELVVTSVENIEGYGVYVSLDEYEKEGFLHISEISSSWVKNIRDFVHEGEKAVLKVLRVDTERRHIDLSLRRVTKRERREKMLQWKQNRKAESLMRTASRRLGISLKDLYEKAWIPLEETFGFVYEGLERAAREGTDVLLDLGLDERLAEIITKVAKEKIKVSYIKTRGILKISCPKPDGVVKIRKALQKAQKVKMSPGTSVKIYAVSPPRYRIEVTARDYKAANSVMRKATQVAVDGIAKSGGYGTFERG